MSGPAAPEGDAAELGPAIGALAAAGDDKRAYRRAMGPVARSMREAGVRSVATGRWLAEALVDAAPHVPVRDLATLREHHGGLSGPALADALIRAASRTTGAIGAVAGAVAGASELSPPAWTALPAEVVVETLAVVAVELKLVAELHEVYGRPVTGSPAERGMAVARAWAEGRGVSADVLSKPGGLGQLLGRTSRREISHLIQRRLARRAVRSLSSLAPFFVGAVAGAQVNRRGTRALGEALARDLSPSRVVPARSSVRP